VARTAGASNVVAVKIIDVDSECGALELPGRALAPGWYRLGLSDAAGNSIGPNNFWVLDPEAAPSLGVAGSSFAVGEPLPLRWQNAPGNRNDWLAVFDADAPRDARSSLAWAYVGARSSGTLALAEPTAEAGWPLRPGRYVVRLLKDDGFELLAESSPFTVE